MAKINEEDPGGKKSQYLGNHVVTTEAGHMVEYNYEGRRKRTTDLQ